MEMAAVLSPPHRHRADRWEWRCWPIPILFTSLSILMTRSISLTTRMSKSDNSPGIVWNVLVKNTYKESIRIFSYFTLALNYYFGGFNVFGYHLVNFIVHMASGIFLYWFLILTFNLPFLKERYGPISYKVALFTSLIFIVHPIQTQSVTYIVQRMASMAGMFYLLSMVLYIKGRLSIGSVSFVLLWRDGVELFAGSFFKRECRYSPCLCCSL